MNSIEEIFKLYSNDVYKYILSLVKDKYTAEDILQDTFYKAFVNMDNYQPGNVKAWLFTIARNCFIDYFRKQRKIILTSDFLQEADTSHINIEDITVTNAIIDDIVKIINTLPIKQRKAIILKDFKSLTYEESAFMMNIKVSTFKTLVHRARKYVKQNYKE